MTAINPIARCCALVGAPACRKTSVVRAVLAGSSHPAYRIGNCHYCLLRGKPVAVLGIYDGGLFDGTDKLSYAVASKAMLVARALRRQGIERVLWEGDRLARRCWLDTFDSEFGPLAMRHYIAHDTDERCRERGSKQSLSWRSGRRSLCARLALQYNAVEVDMTVPRSVETEAAHILTWAAL